MVDIRFRAASPPAARRRVLGARTGHEAVDHVAAHRRSLDGVAHLRRGGELQHAVAQQVTGLHGSNLAPVARWSSASAPSVGHDLGFPMPTSLTFEEHGEGIGDAWTVLRDNAARAGLGTGPELSGVDGARARGPPGHGAPLGGRVRTRGPRRRRGVCRDRAQGLDSPDLLAWLDEGAKDLLSTLAFAPADLDVWFFLKDSPGPRQGWARRQCHETTIHAVDAMSAARGAVPPAAETWIHSELAADGVDELLMGFVPRRRTGLELPEPQTVVVRTTDTGTPGHCGPEADGPRPRGRRSLPRGPTSRSAAPRRRSTSRSGTAATRSPARTRPCSTAGVRRAGALVAAARTGTVVEGPRGSAATSVRATGPARRGWPRPSAACGPRTASSPGR